MRVGQGNMQSSFADRRIERLRASALRKEMHFVREAVPTLIAILVLAMMPAQAGAAETAAELIEQARQYDCGYTAGPGT